MLLVRVEPLRTKQDIVRYAARFWSKLHNRFACNGSEVVFASLVVHRRRPLMLSGWANASVDSISAHAIAYNLSSLRRAAPHLIDPLAIHTGACVVLLVFLSSFVIRQISTF